VLARVPGPVHPCGETLTIKACRQSFRRLIRSRRLPTRSTFPKAQQQTLQPSPLVPVVVAAAAVAVVLVVAAEFSVFWASQEEARKKSEVENREF
jgi:hypothetical protein